MKYFETNKQIKRVINIIKKPTYEIKKNTFEFACLVGKYNDVCL